MDDNSELPVEARIPAGTAVSYVTSPLLTDTTVVGRRA